MPKVTKEFKMSFWGFWARMKEKAQNGAANELKPGSFQYCDSSLTPFSPFLGLVWELVSDFSDFGPEGPK